MGRETLKCPLEPSLRRLSENSVWTGAAPCPRGNISKPSSEECTGDAGNHIEKHKETDTKVFNENTILTKPTLGETSLILFSKCKSATNGLFSFYLN